MSEHTAEKGAGPNLDLDFIDFPSGWAIQRAGLTHTDDRCSALHGPFLCDCNALPFKWAELKTAHDGSDGMALAAPYIHVKEDDK